MINELDEYAIEEALRLKEKHGGEVTILTVGPEQATDSIRKALSMGADKAVHVCDDALAGSDALQTAYAIAQTLGTLEYDLVILGSESTDARTGVVGAALAEYLGLPQLSGLDACRRIRERPWGRRVVIVALTGWGQDEDRQRSKEAGFDWHLVKPVGPDDLARVLATLPDGRGA